VDSRFISEAGEDDARRGRHSLAPVI
jgi:hypothetical protein